MGMNKKHTSSCLTTCIAIPLLAIVMLWLPCRAGEIRYPVPCYEGDALEKVREWEKNWAGKKIDASTIDGIKEYMPETMYDIVKDPKKWGPISLEIVPYRQILPTDGDVKLTKQYSAKCSIGPKEDLLNYVSGVPFPNPQTSLQVAYNFDCINQGDNQIAKQDSFLVDGKRKYDRKMLLDSRVMWFSGRRDIPPVPDLPRNTKGIFRAAHSEFHEPASMRGGRALQIKWKDRTRDYGSWFFSPGSRRILRRSTAQRTDSQGGSDMCTDDNLVYDFTISKLNFKSLGRKELLLSRHQNLQLIKEGHTEGLCVPNGIQYERINAYVLECSHKDPNYIYSKMIWYVDPETWWILYSDKYDRKGRLWKVFNLSEYSLTSIYDKNDVVPTIGNMMIIDVQRMHSTFGITGMVIGGTGDTYKPDYYTPQALQKFGY
jgi:hypothetical protein